MTLIANLLSIKNTLKALMYRELFTRFGHSRYGFIIALLEPIMHVTFFIVLLGYFRAGNLAIPNPFYFVAIPIITFTLFSNIISASFTAINTNMPLFYFRQVTSFWIVIARAILELSVICLAILIIWLTSLFFTDLYLSQQPYEALALFFSIWIMAIGIGLITSITNIFFDWLTTIIKYAMRVMYITSGIFFSPNFFSDDVQAILYLNPLLTVNEAIRKSFFPAYTSNPPVGNILPMALLTLFIGLTVHTLYGRKALSIGL